MTTGTGALTDEERDKLVDAIADGREADALAKFGDGVDHSLLVRVLRAECVRFVEHATPAVEAILAARAGGQQTQAEAALDQVPRCPDCRHAPHGDWCPNWASDNECSCTTAALPERAPTQGEQAVEREVREVWAIRWSDGSVSADQYSGDGSDHAEQMVRMLAGGEQVVHRTVTITRTDWTAAAALDGPDTEEQR